jgi:hypothetical protein
VRSSKYQQGRQSMIDSPLSPWEGPFAHSARRRRRTPECGGAGGRTPPRRYRPLPTPPLAATGLVTAWTGWNLAIVATVTEAGLLVARMGWLDEDQDSWCGRREGSFRQPVVRQAAGDQENMVTDGFPGSL